MKDLGLLSVLERNPTRLKRIKFLGLLFEAHGHTIRIAGGAVRDILRGIEPQDIDFATDAHPDRSLEILKKYEDLVRIIVTASGLKHGTVAIKFKNAEIDFKRIKLSDEPVPNKESEEQPKPEYDGESPYEITTLRCDKFTDGRHAEVEFISDWKKDAERRDLTINAMFLTLDKGELIDYFEGESDLKKGTVRFVGDADLRIKEDYLRILRFFRFWSRYSLDKSSIDCETRSIIQNNLIGLDGISGERLWVEIKKILSYFPCEEVTTIMIKSGIHKHLGLNTPACLREEYVSSVMERIKTVESRVEKYLKNNLKSLSDSGLNDHLVKKIKELLPVIVFACWVPDSDSCFSAHKRMKFSNVERDTILFICENRVLGTNMNELKYCLVSSPRDERPQTMMKIRALLVYEGEFVAIDELDNWQVPTFPIKGHIAAIELKKLGLSGKYMKQILDPLKVEWAESDYELTKQELEQRMFEAIDKIKQSLDKT